MVKRVGRGTSPGLRSTPQRIWYVTCTGEHIPCLVRCIPLLTVTHIASCDSIYVCCHEPRPSLTYISPAPRACRRGGAMF